MKYYIYLCIFVLFLWIIQPDKDGLFAIPKKMNLKNYDKTLCADVLNDKLNMATCNGANSQIWYAQQIADSAYSKIVNFDSKKCLNNELNMGNCENDISKLQWLPSNQLQNMNKCLDFSYNMLFMNECNSEQTQHWIQSNI